MTTSPETIQKVHQVIDNLWDEELLFLKALGSFKSTLGNEREIQSFIQKHLEDMDMKTTSFAPEVDKISSYNNYGPVEWSYEDRPVLAGQWKTDEPNVGKSLILQGHIDVVSAEPEEWWTTPPYEPKIKGNKMYGRGILDMKGGVAAMVYAAKALKKAGVDLGSDLQIQTVIEEECTGNGALALLDKGLKADGALIPEPTALRGMKSQVGVFWVRIKVKGSGAHVERAEQAQNAITKASYLIQSLEEYREYINAQPKHSEFEHHPHPLNVNIGVIEGGDWASNVPSECTFEARIGFYPDVDPEEAKAELTYWITKAAEKDSWLKETPPEITFFGFHAPGSVHDLEGNIFKTLTSAYETTTKKELEYAAFTGTTDVRAFEEFGIPAVCFGPTGANMHGIDEYIELDSLKTVTKTIAAFILDWCQTK